MTTREHNGSPDAQQETQQEALLAGLRRVGLSRYEAAVYLGLVLDQTARVAEISRRTGVPPPKVYQALDALVEKGFCAVGSGAVNRYRPISPRDALSQHISHLKDEEGAAKDLASELEGIYESGAGRELWAPPIEIVKGVAQIRRLLVSRIQEAREEILFMGKGPQIAALEVAEALWDRAEGGIKMRVVFEEGFFDGNEERKEEDALYERMRADKRETKSLPTKMLVVDRSSAMLAIPRGGAEGFLMLVLRQTGLVQHCLASFELAWERARER